jgi:hypothetical protein
LRGSKLRYARDRISEFAGAPEGDALTRIFFKLHHYHILGRQWPTAIFAGTQ